MTLSLYFLSLWIYWHQSVLYGYGGIITCTQSTFLANSIICILIIYNFPKQIPREAPNSILSAGLGYFLGLLFVYMDNSGFGIADVCPCQHPVGITQGWYLSPMKLQLHMEPDPVEDYVDLFSVLLQVLVPMTWP